MPHETTLRAFHPGALARDHLSDRLLSRGCAAGGGAVLRHAERGAAPAAGRGDGGRGGARLRLLPHGPVGEIVGNTELGEVSLGRPVARPAGHLLDGDANRGIAAGAPYDLGVFEGRRKRAAYPVDESYGLTKALLSLMAVTAFLFCLALVLGAA